MLDVEFIRDDHRGATVGLMESVSGPSDLVTSPAETAKGFLYQADARLGHQKTSDYLNCISALRSRDFARLTWDDIFNDEALKSALLWMAMISSKSQAALDRHGALGSAQLREFLERTVDLELLAADSKYRNLLFDRYLLMAGDALGGTMRNEVGKEAQRILSAEIHDSLIRAGHSPTVEHRASGKVKQINWDNRCLKFDASASPFSQNIDFVLLRAGDSGAQATHYLACGELKGGIDPAGAQEHYSTADSKLGNVLRVCEQERLTTTQWPKLFFIAAAIEANMAEDIFRELSGGKLYQVANFNREYQLAELIEALISL